MKSEYIDDLTIAKIESVFRDRDLLLVLRLSGLRIGDIVKIRREDLSINPPGVRYVAEKTGKRGFAPLPVSLVRRLRSRAEIGTGWVFPSPCSRKSPRGHLTRQAVWSEVKRACARAGVTPAGVSPHSFRKSYAVALFGSQGFEAVQKALQHSDKSTTEIYIFSDFCSGKNAKIPLYRGDIPLLCAYIAQYIKGS